MNAPALGVPGERDRLHERLRNLSAILPVFAQELAAARRQAARLRAENARLLDELARLHRRQAAEEPTGSAALRGEPLHGAGPALDGDRRGDRGAALGV